MHTAELVVSAALVVFFLAAGVAGVTAGWTLPWNRGRVLRPRLAGCGALLMAVGFGGWMFLGPLRAPRPAFPAPAWVGWFMFMAGLLVQWLSTRPGGPQATNSAS